MELLLQYARLKRGINEYNGGLISSAKGGRLGIIKQGPIADQNEIGR